MAWENQYYVVGDGVNLSFYGTKDKAIEVCNSLKSFKLCQVYNKGKCIYSKENK